MADDSTGGGGGRRPAGERWLLVGASALAIALAALAVAWPALAIVTATVPYGLAAVGCFAGASAFARDERMRWAWLAIGIGNVFGGLTCAVFANPPLHTQVGPALSAGATTLVIISNILLNVLTVAGLVIFGQAYRSLGPRPSWYRIATLVAFAVGALVVGPALVHAFRGPALDWSSVISSVGDLIAITMIGPLAVTAIAMRGGALLWPYLFLTIGTTFWLVYDASGMLSGQLQVIADYLFAFAGLTFTGAAGVAHRRVVR